MSTLVYLNFNATNCIYLLLSLLFVYFQGDESCGWNFLTSVEYYFYFQVGKNVRLVLPADLVVGTIALDVAQVCPIPGVPDTVLGAINYQEELIWAIDLAGYLSYLLGLARDPEVSGCSVRKDNLTMVAIAPQLPKSQKPIALQAVAWVVSEVYGIVCLNPAKFRPLPTQFKSLLDPFLSGLTEVDPDQKVSDRTTVAVLNVNRLFAALDYQ